MNPDRTEYASRVCRDALRDLYHELYFKAPHFKGLSGHFPRSAMDEAILRLASPEALDLMSDDDHVSQILTEALGRLPNSTEDLLSRWQRAESAVNARIRSLFGMLGPAGTSTILATLSPALRNLPPLESCLADRPLGPKRADRTVGQPDVWLRAPSASVSIEIKVRGGQSRAGYGAEQHLKYLRLSTELRASHSALTTTAHVLLAPLSSRGVLSRHSKWLEQFPVNGQQLVLDPQGFIACLGPRRAAQLEALGGVAWLQEAQGLTPTIALDLPVFLDRAAEHFLTDTFMAEQGITQVQAIRKYSLKPSSRA